MAQFGWVLTGAVGHATHRKSCHFAMTSKGEQNIEVLLKKFWELESPHPQEPPLSVTEQKVLDHFKATHHRDVEGRFVVPLPLKADAIPLGESRTRAIRRFTILE